MFYAKSFIGVSSVCAGCGCGLCADYRNSNAQHNNIAQHDNDTAGRYDHNSRDYEHANNTIYFNYDDLAGIKHNGNTLSYAGHA